MTNDGSITVIVNIFINWMLTDVGYDWINIVVCFLAYIQSAIKDLYLFQSLKLDSECKVGTLLNISNVVISDWIYILFSHIVWSWVDIIGWGMFGFTRWLLYYYCLKHF